MRQLSFSTYIIFFLCAAGLAGCKKLIEIPDNAPTQIVTGQVFADSLSAISGVVGIYSSNFNSTGPFSGTVTAYTGMTSDELIGADPYYEQYNNNALQAGDATNQTGSTGDVWASLYGNHMIYQVNACLEGLNASQTLSATLKNQLTGECEMLRALSYFTLVNLYGDVPLVLSTDYRQNTTLPRASVDTVYAQITHDLQDAVQRLTPQYPSDGPARPNRYTALALLGRVHLYRKEWDKADSAATAIINSGMYKLSHDLDAIFQFGNAENIWQQAGVGYYPYMTLEAGNLLPYAPDIIPQYYLTSFQMAAFEPGDLRKDHWTGANTVDGVNYYYPFKYKNYYGVQINGNEGYVMFRLAEQYLIRAEARIQLGNLTDGAADLDSIRVRAGLPVTTATTQEALLQAVQHERQVELFCELGHRWYDLKRTGTINAVLGAEKSGIWPADGHAALYPVPYGQLLLNNGWKQNPQY